MKIEQNLNINNQDNTRSNKITQETSFKAPINTEEERVKFEEKVNNEKIELLRDNLNKIFNGENKLEKDTKWIKLENNKFDENGFYRVVDENGYKDFIETGIVRSSPIGTDSYFVGKINIGHRPTSFPSFDKGAPDFSYAKKDYDNYIFESGIPMYKRGEINPITESSIRGRHWAYRPIDQNTGDIIKELDSSMIKNIYKLDKDGNIYIKEK